MTKHEKETENMTQDPFAKPASAVGIKWADLQGALLILDVKSVEEGIMTTFGESDAVRADVHVVDGAQAGTTYPDALVFPKGLASQLRPNVGQKVLGRLGQGQAKPGQSPPWLLAEATDADKQAGMAFLNRNTFTQPQPAQAQAQPPF